MKKVFKNWKQVPGLTRFNVYDESWKRKIRLSEKINFSESKDVEGYLSFTIKICSKEYLVAKPVNNRKRIPFCNYKNKTTKKLFYRKGKLFIKNEEEIVQRINIIQKKEYRFYLIRLEPSLNRKVIISVGKCPLNTFLSHIEPFFFKEIEERKKFN